MTTILFWDIDGTLLSTKRAGIFALEDAASSLTGVKLDLSNLETAGMTDTVIASRILELAGMFPDKEKIDRLLQLYGSYLPSNLPKRQGYVLDGVKEILDCLRDRNDVVSMLLTGNIKAGAQAKLSYYGLDSYFTEGAFSDDAEDRVAIANLAFSVAQEKLGQVFPDKMYVIGDTPHDIHCSKAINARAIAVATGGYTLDELEKHEPWWAIESLPAPEVFLEKIGLI